MTTGALRRLRGGLVMMGLAVAAALPLAGCTTSATTTSGPVTEARSGPPQPGDADAGRRARVRLELAGAYFSRGQMDFALSEIKLAIAADPTLGAAYNLRGLIHSNMGEQREAEENFRRALALNPRDIDALQNYGWYLCQQKRFGEADAQFEQILAVPQNRDAARTLLAQGVCQSRAGQLDAAERSLMRAYELDQGNVTISFNLAELLLRRGEAERARFYVRRINNTPGLVNAQTLWLAARIENKLGNRTGVQELGLQLRSRFRESREAVAFERGQFDE